MIKEDYVSYEIAKLLKEKGFDVPYDSFRGVYINGEFLRRNPGGSYLWNTGDEIIDACSIQIAMKWLREVHHLAIDVFHFRDWKVNIKTIPDDYFKADYSYPELKPAETYEQACEAAIKYCLENLVQKDNNPSI